MPRPNKEIKAWMIDIARRKAREHGLPSKLVCAVIETESGWYAHAARTEPGFYSRYIQPIKWGRCKVFGSTSRQTERRTRSISFGLMQVMGQVARELGCDLECLTELCDPVQGIEYGCRKLAKAFERTASRASTPEEHTRLALLRYNGGSDKHYPDRVLGRVSNYDYNQED